uniref:hypothetical protein n=1 Tax=Symbiobacterium terraclitae TaxID=557451 RepID=UPI0035B524AE
MSMREALAGLVQEWRRAGEPRSGGSSVLSEERRAGAAEAYRECARQLSMVLASHPTETLEAGVVVVPVSKLDGALHDLAFEVMTRCVKGRTTILVD